jgi:hypothetical protein
MKSATFTCERCELVIAVRSKARHLRNCKPRAKTCPCGAPLTQVPEKRRLYCSRYHGEKFGGWRRGSR